MGEFMRPQLNIACELGIGKNNNFVIGNCTLLIEPILERSINADAVCRGPSRLVQNLRGGSTGLVLGVLTMGSIARLD